MKLVVALVTFLTSAGFGYAQGIPDQLNQLAWQKSGTFQISGIATLQMPVGTMALQPSDATRFLELLGNLPRPNVYLVSASNVQWFAAFTYDASGYVRDNEKIDADDLLATLKRQNEAGNAERQKRGLKPLYLQGWYVQPHYDVVSKRLEWGTKLLSENGGVTVNYTARVLGRSGVMSATLVSDPETLDQDVRSFHSLLQNLSFVGGQRYEEFRPGDKVAEYGLAALVVGGAAAVAAKSGAGFLKMIGLAIFAFFATIFGAIKRLFTGKK